VRCPYCVSEIADEALACPRCTRDLYLFKPLLAKIDELEKAVAVAGAAAERIAALEAEVAALKGGTAGTAPAGATAAAPAEIAPSQLAEAAEAVVAEATAT
jgi:hypothetical protein